jgi:hypothetical protein
MAPAGVQVPRSTRTMSWCSGKGTSVSCWHIILSTIMKSARTLRLTRMRHCIGLCRPWGSSHRSVCSAASITNISGRHNRWTQLLTQNTPSTAIMSPPIVAVSVSTVGLPLCSQFFGPLDGARATMSRLYLLARSLTEPPTPTRLVPAPPPEVRQCRRHHRLRHLVGPPRLREHVPRGATQPSARLPTLLPRARW